MGLRAYGDSKGPDLANLLGHIDMIDNFLFWFRVCMVTIYAVWIIKITGSYVKGIQRDLIYVCFFKLIAAYL